jgi:hypothetical protein
MLVKALTSTIAMSLYSSFEDLKPKLAQNYIILAEVLKSKYQKLTLCSSFENLKFKLAQNCIILAVVCSSGSGLMFCGFL